MKNWILVLVVLVLFGSASTAHADGPAVDLVEMFGNAPDTKVSGVQLTSVMNVKYGRGQIRNVYNSIYYNGIDPNQIVCSTSWYADENNPSKIVPKVMWSVWYRPSAMVAKTGTECVDTKQNTSATTRWWKAGYRWLGSGVEPHMQLLWLGHWTEIQSPTKTSYKWCKALEFSYAQNPNSDAKWTPVLNKAVFDYAAASGALALVSRDIICTSEVKAYGKWMKTPGWSFYFVNP